MANASDNMNSNCTNANDEQQVSHNNINEGFVEDGDAGGGLSPLPADTLPVSASNGRTDSPTDSPRSRLSSNVKMKDSVLLNGGFQDDKVNHIVSVQAAGLQAHIQGVMEMQQLDSEKDGEKRNEEAEEDRERKPRFKYNWRHLLPLNIGCNDPNLSEMENSGFIQLFLHTWATGIIVKGFKNIIQLSDLMDFAKSEAAAPNFARFQRYYKEEQKKCGRKDVSVAKVLCRTLRTRYIIACLIIMLSQTFEFLGPAIMLKRLLTFIESSPDPPIYGLKWLIGLVLCMIGRSWFFAGCFYFMVKTGVAARAMVLSLVYNKLVKLKNVGDKSLGELVNLCANDAQRIFECGQFAGFLLAAPYMMTIATIYLYYMLGPSSLVGIGVMLFFLPIQAILGKLTGKMRQKAILVTDERVKMINEILSSIKLIKMYAWEKPFAKVVHDLRSKEQKVIWILLYIQIVNMALTVTVIAISPIATFIVHVSLGYDLTVAQAFIVISIFNAFPASFALLPMAVRGISEARVACKRFTDLLAMEEYIPISSEPENTDMALVIKGGHFAWDSVESVEEKEENAKPPMEQNGGPITREIPNVAFKKKSGSSDSGLTVDKKVLIPVLQDINLEVRKGSVIGICGVVGSGKTSLIDAILGQVHLTKGSIDVVKSVAYVAQQAWILNSTVRDNITFSKDYNEARYNVICSACGLDKDFENLPSGDLTEIGERGINLSGGQKQRISLARAVYADAELYLLDDPLSAVDAHVGQHIFKNLIKDELHGRTIIFVTHQLQYLQDCDDVIFLSAGKIVEHGTYHQLVLAKGEFSEMMHKFHKEHIKEDVKSSNRNVFSRLISRNRTSSIASSLPPTEQEFSLMEDCDTEEEEEERIVKGKIIEKEERSQGSVTWRTYRAFFKAAGGYFISFSAIFFQISVVGLMVFNQWWLSDWLNVTKQPVTSKNGTTIILRIADHPETNRYMLVYGCLGAAVFLLQLISSVVSVLVFIHASSTLHKLVLNKVLKSPMRFFDTTPSGRILNRLSRDQDELDSRLPWATESFVRNASRIAGSLAVISIIFPWFLLSLLPMVVVFLFLNAIFRRSLREFKRLDNITRSPMFSHITATVQGLPTLHAYKQTEKFVAKFIKLVDNNTAPFYMFYVSNRWFSIRLDMICVLIGSVACLFALFTKGTIPAALAALSVTYALRMTGLFQFTCRLFAETEARFTSVERMNYYIEEIESEAPSEIADTKPKDDWPADGKIAFKDVQLRYRPGTPLVLKNLDFTVNPKEKIGIVGRTGAGKSSLGIALFRIAEPDSGEICIDDVNIMKIGLHDLRSRLSIIPQDPVLFIGTLRYNLDPFHKHNDQDLWLSLEKAHMKDTVSNLPLKLEAPVVENGANFSVGERQLICMARALLRQTKILMLDEATAAIDSQTDSKIQDTIRDSFKDCTLLTIAHRLNTVMYCDRVLVMDEGKVAEFDTPTELLSKPDSLFTQMAVAAKIAYK